MFHFQFLDQLSSFYVVYISESNDANNSKKKTLWYIIEHIEATIIKPFHYSHYISEPISFDILNCVRRVAFLPAFAKLFLQYLISHHIHYNIYSQLETYSLDRILPPPSSGQSFFFLPTTTTEKL